MQMRTTWEPFEIAFTLEELRLIEDALSEARTSEYLRAKELMDKFELPWRGGPEVFVEDFDALLQELERLDLWNESRYPDWDAFDDEWDERVDGPDLPCHLMDRLPPPQ